MSRALVLSPTPPPARGTDHRTGARTPGARRVSHTIPTKGRLCFSFALNSREGELAGMTAQKSEAPWLLGAASCSVHGKVRLPTGETDVW